MKKILVVAFLFFAFLSSRAQQAVVYSPEENNYNKSPETVAIESKFFCCPQCDFTSQVSGVCPRNQVALVKVGQYYCLRGHGYSSEKPGTCPADKSPLVQMHMKYATVYPKPKD